VIRQIFITKFKRQLENLGSSLNQEREQQLLTVIGEETNNAPTPASAAALNDIGGMLDNMAAGISVKEQTNRKIIERAEAILDPVQLKALEDFQTAALQQETSRLQAFRQVFQGGGIDTQLPE